jgi:protease-4
MPRRPRPTSAPTPGRARPASVLARTLGHACLAAALGVAALGCGARGAEADKKPSVATLYELDLHEALPEQGIALFGDHKPGLSDGLTKLYALLDEPLVKGLFVRLGPLEGSFGDLADWAALFDAYRAQKRIVHCHFDALDNLGFALANHCDRLTMTPAGMLDVVGLGAQLVHGRKLLELLGVRAELLQIGKYKGAAEPFTRDAPSEELRQSIDGMLDDLDHSFRAHLMRGGARSEQAVRELIDAGPFDADAARNRKLVDALAYDDEARASAKKAAAAAAVRALFPERKDGSLSLRDLLDALTAPEDDDGSSEARLGLVFLDGEIVDGDQRSLERAASEPFVKAMRRFADDARVRAIVLRIESPGGSALASDRMWHAVRRAAGRKPVVVSIGDMAASGGYYVASAGSHVLASPGSIVGSIGVVGGKLVLADLAQRVGVNVTSIERAEHATWLSALEPFTPDERQRLEQLLSHTYQLFLERVSLGRKRTIEQLLPAAEGRVMGGERAKQLGLIDEIGGLGRAIALARERGKLPKDAPLARWPEQGDALGALRSLLGASAPGARLAADLERLDHSTRAVASSAPLRALAHARSPLLTALPFALIVR